MTQADEGSKPRTCPRDQSPLAVKQLAGVTIDECRACGGVWLDEGELRQLQDVLSAVPDKARNEDPTPAETVKRAEALAKAEASEAASERAHPAECPVCQAELLREEYAHTSQVLIDVCPLGCGIWLDGGELRTLESLYERERAKVAAAPKEAFVWKVREVWAGLVGALRSKRKPKGDVEAT